MIKAVMPLYSMTVFNMNICTAYNFCSLSSKHTKGLVSFQVLVEEDFSCLQEWEEL